MLFIVEQLNTVTVKNGGQTSSLVPLVRTFVAVDVVT